MGLVDARSVFIAVVEQCLRGQYFSGSAYVPFQIECIDGPRLRIVQLQRNDGISAQAGLGEVSSPLPGSVSTGYPAQLSVAPRQITQELNVRGTLHQRVRVLGVRGRIVARIVVGGRKSVVVENGIGHVAVRDVDPL